MEYNVVDFGAVGDGITNDSIAIQKAIDECAKAGGGKVVFPSGGIFRAGALIFQSNIEYHFEMGSVLKGSDNFADYQLFEKKEVKATKLSKPTYEDCEYAGVPTMFFIYAKGCENIAITGFGKIDGNEEIFYGNITPYHIDGQFYPRAPLMYLEDIKHLTMQQITLTGSAFWTVHMIGCEDVLIDGIRILNSLNVANCDGIDPDRCKNVRITNCHIECADDCIVFKNTENTKQYGISENIIVSNCNLISTSAAIKFGSESEDLYRNIIIENCNISKSNRGISIQLRDKGSVENVIFSNINIDTRLFSPEHWWGKAEPIAITAVKRKEETQIGHVKNILFKDITCVGENGIFIYGDESMNIENIRFERVSIKIEERTKWKKQCYDIRPTIGSGMFEDDMAAVYVKNGKDISFSQFKEEVTNEMSKYMKEKVHIEDSENVVFF